MSKLRVLHVGCGGITRAWFSTPTMQEQVEVVGLCDRVPAAAERLKEKQELDPDLPIGTDVATMIDQLQPEAVFDTTVPVAHHDVTTAALAKGCHVLGEKPLADSMARAQAMVAAAAANDRIYAVTQTRRWNPEIQRLRSFLQSDAIGTPHTFDARFAIAADFGGFRAEMEHVLLLDMAVHSFDQARVLVGSAKPIWVQAHEWNPVGSNYAHHANATATFAFDNGSVFTYHGTWTAAGRQTSWECDWRIQGTRGAVTWRGEDGIVAQGLADPDQPAAEHGGGLIRELLDIDVPQLPDVESFAKGHDGAIRDFVSAVQNGHAPECPGSDNIHSLAMVLGAIESAETGQRVDLSR